MIIYLIFFLIIYLILSKLCINYIYIGGNICNNLNNSKVVANNFKKKYKHVADKTKYKKYFINFINKEIYNLTNENFQAIDFTNNNSFFWYIKPTSNYISQQRAFWITFSTNITEYNGIQIRHNPNINPNDINPTKCYTLLDNFKTKINNKYNELVSKIKKHIGGSNIIQKYCSMIKKLETNKTLNIIDKYSNNYSKQLKNLKIIHDNFNTKIKLIMETGFINSNELRELISNLYIKTPISVKNLIRYYNNSNESLSNKYNLPNNYKYIFNLEYIKDLYISGQNTILLRNNTGTYQYPSDYKFNTNNNYLNFYLTTSHAFYNNAALYIEDDKAYILYHPDDSNPKSRTMFNSNTSTVIQNKKFIKLNHFIFEIQTIHYHPVNPIKFDIKYSNIKFNPVNFDYLLTNIYSEQSRYLTIIETIQNNLYIFHNTNDKNDTIISDTLWGQYASYEPHFRKISGNNITEYLEFLLNFLLYDNLYKDIYKVIDTNKQSRSFYDNIYVFGTAEERKKNSNENKTKYDELKDKFISHGEGIVYSGVFKVQSDINSNFFNDDYFVKLDRTYHMISYFDMPYLLGYNYKINDDNKKINIKSDYFHNFILKKYRTNFAQFYLLDKSILKYILENNLFESSSSYHSTKVKSSIINIFNILIYNKDKVKNITKNIARVIKSWAKIFIDYYTHILENETQKKKFIDIYNSYNIPSIKEYELILLLKNYTTDRFGGGEVNLNNIAKQIIESTKLKKELTELVEVCSVMRDIDYAFRYGKIKSKLNLSAKFKDILSSKRKSGCANYVTLSYLLILKKIWFADEDLAKKILKPINDYLGHIFEQKTTSKSNSIKLYSTAYSHKLQLNLLFNDISENLILLYNKYKLNPVNTTGKTLNLESVLFKFNHSGMTRNLIVDTNDFSVDSNKIPNFTLKKFKIE